MSYLVHPDDFRRMIESAGFRIEAWHDKTDLARAAFAKVTEPVGEPDLPILGVHMLVGSDIKTKAWNLHRNLEEDRVTLIETLVTK